MGIIPNKIRIGKNLAKRIICREIFEHNRHRPNMYALYQI